MGTLLKLTLEVEVLVSAAELVLEQGRVVAVRPGPASATASLSAGDVVLARRPLVAVDLESDIRLSDHPLY